MKEISPASGDNSFPTGFADFFRNKAPAKEEGSCHYVKLPETEILEVEEEDVDPVEELWGHCLLGCFAGRFPGLKAIRNMVDSWKTDCEILPHQSGWVVFKFQNKVDQERILAGGPYFIFRITLLLRSIPENFSFQYEDYSVVPTWVQLHNLPLQCWNTRVISQIASKLGKPLCVDNITLERRRISYARVLIEIDALVKPIEEFEVKLPSGVIYKQYVHYKNIPKFCKHCYIFGHLRENCRFLAPLVSVEKGSTEKLAKNLADDLEEFGQQPGDGGVHTTESGDKGDGAPIVLPPNSGDSSEQNK